MPQPLPRRFKALDGLRGVAALMVIFYHTPWLTHFSNLRLVNNAYVTVDFFFILSGFVIAANYADRIFDGESVVTFMTARFFRLYPLHFCILVGLLGLETVKFFSRSVAGSAVPPFTGPNSPRLLVENLLMIQGLGLEDRLGWNQPSWSVSAEFATYIAFAAAVLAGMLRRRAVVVALAAVALMAYIAIAASQHTLDTTYALGLGRCLAGFSLGVAIHSLSEPSRREGESVLRWTDGLASAAALSTLAVIAVAEGAAIVLTIPLFVFLITALQFERGVVARLLSSGPAQFLGRVSYSIYLLHMPIFLMSGIVLKRALGKSHDLEGHGPALAIGSTWLGDLLFAGVIAVVLVLARITYASIEEPARRFGRRLNTRLVSAPAPEAVRLNAGR